MRTSVEASEHWGVLSYALQNPHPESSSMRVASTLTFGRVEARREERFTLRAHRVGAPLRFFKGGRFIGLTGIDAQNRRARLPSLFSPDR